LDNNHKMYKTFSSVAIYFDNKKFDTGILTRKVVVIKMRSKNKSFVPFITNQITEVYYMYLVSYVCGGVDFASLDDFSTSFGQVPMWYFFILLAHIFIFWNVINNTYCIKFRTAKFLPT